jgi:hypothetical protein
VWLRRAPAHCPNGGVADSLDEAKAAFHGRRRKATIDHFL